MELMEHQISGSKWLRNERAGILGDVPGSGKTLTLATAARALGITSPLVICPAIVRTQWQRELPAATVMSYDQVVRCGNIRTSGSLLILDEFHYLKNPSSQRTQAILGRPKGLAHNFFRVWLASGSPLPRHAGDIWPVIAALFPGIAVEHNIRNRQQWLDRFTVYHQYPLNGRIITKFTGNKNTEELRQILDRIMIRRQPTPDQIWWQQLVLDGPLLAPVEASLAEAWEKRIEHGSRQDIGLLKVKPIVERLASELETTEEKVVLYFYHRSVGDALYEAFTDLGLGPVFINGATPQSVRQSAIRSFQSDPACRVFLGQIQATGTGLDGLQSVARRCIFVEPSWVPNDNYQAAKRLDRIGGSGCIAQFVSLSGSIDEAIIAQNIRETRNLEEILNARQGQELGSSSIASLAREKSRGSSGGVEDTVFNDLSCL